MVDAEEQEKIEQEKKEKEQKEADAKREAQIKAEDETHIKLREHDYTKRMGSADNPIAEAKEILSKIEAQNKALVENIKRAEKAGAELMLAGRAPAGTEKTQEQEAEERARKLVAGTGMEKMAGFKEPGAK